LIAAVVLISILRTVRGHAPDETPALAQASFATGPTERVTITLGDGTVVRLGAESHLRVTARPRERALWLEGHAYFAVAKHRYPFVVRTSAGEALAHGTRFDLEAHGSQLRLLVVEGRVDLTGATRRVEVGAGEFGRIEDRDPVPVSRPADVDSRL